MIYATTDMPSTRTRAAAIRTNASGAEPVPPVAPVAAVVDTEVPAHAADAAEEAIAPVDPVPDPPADPVPDPPAEAPNRGEKRARGRPRKEKPPEVSPFDPELPGMDFSLTVVSAGQHCPPVWCRMIYEFCVAHGLRCAVALERGGKNEHLHVQAVVTFPALTDDATIEVIKKMLKAALGSRRGDGQKWYVPSLTPPLLCLPEATCVSRCRAACVPRAAVTRASRCRLRSHAECLPVPDGCYTAKCISSAWA